MALVPEPSLARALAPASASILVLLPVLPTSIIRTHSLSPSTCPFPSPHNCH